MTFYFRVICFCLIPIFSQAQERFTLQGQVSDKKTGEALQGVSISASDENEGTITNIDGEYNLKLPVGTHQITFDFLGYKTIVETINMQKNKTLDIVLEPSSESLDVVVITNNTTTEPLQSPQMSVAAIKPAMVKKLPAVLGEADVVKSLMLLPGISSGGEISTGFNVRGGSSDQNLTLLDNATLYNPSHLFGFFSVFNSDAQKSIKLYKGGIPTRFGGRASSVLDIQQRTGNREKYKFEGSIGAVSAKALAEGPIKKDKSSFLVAGRSSYAHLFLKLADEDNSAYFYDLNAKLDYTFNQKNTLYFSGYFGQDVFNINNQFKTSYGNTVANLRWKHRFNNNHSSDLYLIYSDFQNNLKLEPLEFKYNSGIKNLNLIYDFNQEFSTLKLNYGINSKYYLFNPGSIQPTSENSGIIGRQFIKKYAWENSVYAEAKQKLSEEFSINYGVRFNMFNRLGQEQINLYENNQPVIYNPSLGRYEEAPIIDSYSTSKNKTVKTYYNIEPRASISYKFNDNNAFKASFQRLHQYIQMLTNSNSPTPYNLWAPAGEYIKPLRADQYALGYFHDFENEDLRFETEVYYKDFKNQIDYISGADLIANDAVERIVLNGEGRAYGLEVLLRKNTGRLTGWVAYTLSKAEQRTPGRISNEPGINNGKWYNSPWDKTHDISITANYELNKKWEFNAVFIYQTGQPVTFPVSQYEYEDQNIPNYGNRNTNRLFDFHHLDLSATLTPKKSSNRRRKGEWVFSIYNVYNCKNAASLNFAENENTGINEAKRLSIFGIIPSVSYQFKF